MRKTRPEKSKLVESINLTDNEIEDLVGLLWENIESLPFHVQSLLYDSQEPGKVGSVSYALVAGWVLGKFDFVPADFVKGTKAGWVSKDDNVN